MFMVYHKYRESCWLGVVLAIAAWASPGEAQSRAGDTVKRPIEPVGVVTRPKIHDLKVTFGCSNVPEKNVFAVINGDDRNRVQLKQEGNEWTATAPLLDLANANASVHFGVARTDCRLPRVVEWHDRVARFDFPWCGESVQKLRVSTTPKIKFSYVRELTSGQDNSVPCHEQAAALGSEEVMSFHLPAERLLLQLGPWDPYPEGLGLLLFSEDPLTPGILRLGSNVELLVNDPILKIRPGTIENGLTFKREDIVQSLIVKNKKRPLTGPALDIYEKTFGDLKTLDVTVVR
jgi:hypothetical protein